MYALINLRQYFSLLIEGCNFIQQLGNMILFQELIQLISFHVYHPMAHYLVIILIIIIIQV